MACDAVLATYAVIWKVMQHRACG